MNDSPETEVTFEQALSELEEIIRALEDGQLGLEDSLKSYEAGVALLKRCYSKLSDAEQRILLLTGTDAEGKPVTEPFDHTATAESLKSGQKRKPTKNL